MAVCSGTKENAEVVSECPGPVRFADDDWDIIAEAVKDGNTSKYNVGDTKTVELDINDDGTDETYTLRIANNSIPTECGQPGFSQTACGFVIEFADIITTRPMNGNRTNAGGWEGSAMRTYVNGTIYKALVAAIGDTDKDRPMIIDTKVVSGHGNSSNETSNFESLDKVYLLSAREVWGSGLYDTAGGETITRQLDWYEQKKVTTDNNDDRKNAKKYYGSTASVWWLRSAYSNSTSGFFSVYTNGSSSNSRASNAYGVSPAFRLG